MVSKCEEDEFVTAILECGKKQETAVYLFNELKRLGSICLLYGSPRKVKKLAKRFNKSHKRYRLTELQNVGGDWICIRIAKIS